MTSLNLAICSTSRTSCEKVNLNTAVNCTCCPAFDISDRIALPFDCKSRYMFVPF